MAVWVVTGRWTREILVDLAVVVDIQQLLQVVLVTNILQIHQHFLVQHQTKDILVVVDLAPLIYLLAAVAVPVALAKIFLLVTLEMAVLEYKLRLLDLQRGLHQLQTHLEEQPLLVTKILDLENISGMLVVAVVVTIMLLLPLMVLVVLVAVAMEDKQVGQHLMLLPTWAAGAAGQGGGAGPGTGGKGGFGGG